MERRNCFKKGGKGDGSGEEKEGILYRLLDEATRRVIVTIIIITIIIIVGKKKKRFEK